jgi:phytanoyl-CoA hydroxylase
MHVIPGSHLRGPQPHYHDRDCQLPDDAIDVEHDLVVPLEPGGALFFHGLLFHGTPPNQSAAKRRALQFHFASTECRTMSEEQHEALFSDRGGRAGCRDWASKKPPRRIADRQS